MCQSRVSDLLSLIHSWLVHMKVNQRVNSWTETSLLVMYGAGILESPKLDEPLRKEDQWIASDPRTIVSSGRVAPHSCQSSQFACSNNWHSPHLLQRAQSFRGQQSLLLSKGSNDAAQDGVFDERTHKPHPQTMHQHDFFPIPWEPWGQWVQSWHPVKAARPITLTIFSILAPFDYGRIAVLTLISFERQSFPVLSV